MTRNSLFTRLLIALLPVAVLTTGSLGTAQDDTSKSDAAPADSIYVDPSRSVAVDYADPEDVAKTLNSQFEGFSFIASASTKRIYFRAPKDVQAAVEDFVANLDNIAQQLADHEEREKHKKETQIAEQEQQRLAQQQLKITTLRLLHVKAMELGKVLDELEMLRGAAISIHPDGQSLTIRGTDESIEPIIKLAEVLDQPQPEPNTNPKTTDNAGPEDPLISKYGQSGTRGTPLGSKPAIRTMLAPEEGPIGLMRALRGTPKTSPEVIDELRKNFDEAEQQVKQLSKELANPDLKHKDALRGKLKSAIKDAFEQRQRLQMAQVMAQRAKLNTMWQRISLREKIASEIIDRRFAELADQRKATTVAASAAKAAAPNLKGNVQIQAIDKDLIVIRGGKEDVDRVAGLMQKIELSSGPRPYLRRETDGSLILNADSPKHLQEILDSLPKWYSGKTVKESWRPGSDGTSGKFVGQVTTVDRAEEILTDMQRVASLGKSLKSAKDVIVRLTGPKGSTATLAFGKQALSLPAKFPLDGGLEIPVMIADLPESLNLYATLRIGNLSEESRQFFQSHRLPVAISMADAMSVVRGKLVVKSYHLQKVEGELCVVDYSSAEPSRITKSHSSEQVAELRIGNQPPANSDSEMVANKFQEGAKRNIADSILNVEAIVRVKIDKSNAKAFYARGTVVGDDGLLVVVLPADFQEAVNSGLAGIDSIVATSMSGEIVNDAKVVGYDRATRLVLLHSPNMAAPGLAPNGPDVVVSQWVSCAINLGSYATREVDSVRGDGSPYFTLTGGNLVAGSPVHLETTKQLVGVVAHGMPEPVAEAGNALVAENAAEGYTQVVPASTIRRLISDFRQRDLD